jgi:branched-chain amino acid transport system substrate-binding protein
MAPQTGSIAHLGKDNENGARLAIDELNQAGVEIGGKKVKLELVSEDDQADAKTYTRAGFKTAYRVIANDVAQGKALGGFAVDTLKAKNIAVIDDKTAYGQGLATEFENAAKAKGATIVTHESTQSDKTDFKAILTNIKAKKPDIVFFGGMDAQAGPMAQQMKQLGISAKLLGGDGFQSPKFIELAGDAAEGQYASSPGMPKEQLPGFAEFNAAYKKKFNSDIQIYAPYTYDAVKVMVEAMKRAGSAEPAKYLPEIAKTDMQGKSGPIKFDDKGDIVGGSVTIYQAKGGKWEVLTTVGGAAAAPAAAPAAEAKPADAAKK